MIGFKKLLVTKIIPCLLVGVFLILPFSTKDYPVPSTILKPEQCMQVNLYYEARGESERGMKAVAAVVYNRAQSRVYPSSICKVIFQNKQFSWTHQQDQKEVYKLLEGSIGHLSKKDKEKYLLAKKIARMPQKEVQKVLPSTKVLWYHSSTVKPHWNKKVLRVAQIGSHIFYKKV